MTTPIRFTVTEEEAGRVDKLLAARYPGTSRRRLRDLFDGGHVRVNGRRAKKGDSAPAGAEIELRALPADDAAMQPQPQQDLPVAIAFVDDCLVVIDKPAGMASHPLKAGELGTAANFLAGRFDECAAIGDDPREAGLVNRLDRGTTGALVAARNRDAWTILRSAFSTGRVRKEYLALVAGTAADGRCDEPIVHDRQRGGVRIAGDRDFDALEARTSWTVEQQLADRTLLRCIAHTGRMHQIRVHLAHCGYPIVGDEHYGGPPAPMEGHFLHAAVVELAHPITREPLRVEVALPSDRQQLLDG